MDYSYAHSFEKRELKKISDLDYMIAKKSYQLVYKDLKDNKNLNKVIIYFWYKSPEIRTKYNVSILLFDKNNNYIWNWKMKNVRISGIRQVHLFNTIKEARDKLKKYLNLECKIK